MSTKTSIKRVALVAVSALGFGLLSVVPAKAASATVSTGTSIALSANTVTVVAGATATTTATFAGTAVSAAACTVATAETVPNGSSIAGATAAGGTSLTAATLAAQATAGGTIAPTTTGTSGAWSASSVLSLVTDVPGTYTVTMTMTVAACSTNSVDPAAGQPTATWTVIATPSTTSGSAITATQTASTGVAAASTTITVSRTTGANTDGQILGQFTVTADATDAPLSTVYGGVVGASGAVTVGGTAAAPTFAVARTNLAVGSYTMRFWVDTNSNGAYESSETSTTISFTVAGALSTIAVSINNPIRSNVSGHQTFTVTATISDSLGGASAGTVYVSESNATGTADATTTYTDIVNDTALTRVGTTNTYVGTFAIDTNAATATGSNLVYIAVANAADLTASTTKVGVASIRLVRFATLDDAGAEISAFDAVGIGAYTAGVRDALTDDSDALASDSFGAITVDPAITSITFTGTADAGETGEYVYLSTTPTAGNSATCAPSAGSYVPVLGDLSFSYTVATTCIDGEGYTVKFSGADEAGIVVTFDDPAPAWTTAPGGSYTALVGSSNSITGTLQDQYGRALASKSVTAVVTGRNPETEVLTTDASGMATWTGKDSYTGLLTTDSVTFNYNYTNSLGTTSTASSTARVITYAATLAAVGSVTVTEASANTQNIDQKQVAGIPAARVTYTATVKTATGAPIASGVLVTCVGNADDKFYGSASGVTTSTSNGQVTVSVYRQKVGYSTISCSANGVTSSASSDVFWTNQDTDVRNVSLSAAQSVTAGNTATVIATVTDRWGNAIYSVVPVTFTISGVGRLQTGSSIATAINTNTAGQAQIQVTSNDGELGDMTIGASITGGQELDADGYVAGTAIAGVKAGNATASTKVTFVKSTAVSTADALLELAKAIGTGKEVEAATDAAAEAIDAANAATDAANLAAEAADAATVAAEEARDAADAATAAVEELSTQVATLMAALKAQLTTLANTVAKIAKKVKA